MAEKARFELAVPEGTTPQQGAGFGHSPTSPKKMAEDTGFEPADP